MKTLLQRYYDGETTLDEERRLRAALNAQRPTLNSATENERAATQAVMTYGMKGSPQRAPRMRLWIATAAAAACVVMLMLMPSMQYVAWVDGTRVTDAHSVHTLMMADLRDMAQAHEQLCDDVSMNLDLMSNALKQ